MVRNNISNVQADAIVNPANEDLLEGSGTSKAIYMAAGEQKLKEACEKIGHCDLGKAVITDAFDLQARYIIHAVGSLWEDGNCAEEKMLYSAYFESMKLAEQYKCESIAFPLLSSGNYGYPKDKAMKVAISAISDFLLDHEMLIYMVLYDRDSLMISQKLFSSIEEYIDDHYVKENDEIFEEDENSRNFSRKDSVERRFLRRGIKSLHNADSEIANTIAYELSPSISVKPTGKRSWDSIVDNLEETFSEMLLRLIDERGLKDSAVYKKANIDRRHFSKIRNDSQYMPTKKTVFSFVIALELSMDESVDLMKRAGFAFSKSSKFDVILSYFIENKNYDIYEINEVLFHYGQPTLGEL